MKLTKTGEKCMLGELDNGKLFYWEDDSGLGDYYIKSDEWGEFTGSFRCVSLSDGFTEHISLSEKVEPVEESFNAVGELKGVNVEA